MHLRLASPLSPPHFAAAPAPSRDAALQSVRRLDWRFLLPDPRLGHVAYLGPGRDRLLPALREHGRLVAVVPSDEEAPNAALRDGSFDVVVVQAPRRRALARAAALLRPGGWLYCELPRSSWPGRAHLLRAGAWSDNDAGRGEDVVRGPRGACALLAELGFAAIEPYWHCPDFERCSWLVPVDSPAAGVFFVGRGGGRALAPVAAATGGWIVRAGAALRMLPCVSLIACRGGTA